MINTVRNTVLSVLNKNNYGYISPSDFNLFAKQAQLDIFESYFYEYNYQINKENARQSGTGLADIKKGIEESIDIFSVTKGLYINTDNLYYLPSPTTTGSDYYLLNKVLVYQNIVVVGETTSFTAGGNVLTDSNAEFVSNGVSVGDIIAVENGGVQYIKVVQVVDEVTINTTGGYFDASSKKYTIYKKDTKLQEAEFVSNSKITMLNNSVLTSPSLLFPAYTQEANTLTAHPDSLASVGQVLAQYIRYPKDPKWTYIEIQNGQPIFDSTQSDYQDFEIPFDDQVTLILKILQYAGISIREGDVYNFANTEENENTKEQS